MKVDLTALEHARVLVVGDVMLDRYWHGGTSRISPEAPVPVVRVEDADDRPGGAANVALNVASLAAMRHWRVWWARMRMPSCSPNAWLHLM